MIRVVLEEYPEVLKGLLDNWQLYNLYLTAEDSGRELPGRIIKGLPEDVGARLFQVTLGPERKHTLGLDFLHGLNYFSERLQPPSVDEIDRYMKFDYDKVLQTISPIRKAIAIKKKVLEYTFQPPEFNPAQQTKKEYLEYVGSQIDIYMGKIGVQWVQGISNLRRDVTWLVWNLLEGLSVREIADRWAQRQSTLQGVENVPSKRSVVEDSTVSAAIRVLKAAVDNSTVVAYPEHPK